MHYVLMYDLAPGYLEGRGAFRNDHLARAWQAQERGELVLAGAFSDPADTVLFVFESTSPDVAERFAREDPYVQNGLVAAWRVRPWMTVVGEKASTPLRPAP